MASSFNYTQGSANTIWTIAHNLNSDAVVIDCFIDNGGNLEKIIPLETKHTNNNTITVAFSSAQTGRARVAI